jgi:UDP-2,3-diacylglucosamine pyrophosphatase LpxH
MNNYFYQFFIPFIKEVKKTNDKLVVLGDIFDNRTSINTKVLNSVVKLFETLSKIIEIHIILGNHDIFAMTDPEINSVVSIRNISNIIIYNEPTLVTFDNTKCLFMP